MTYTSIEQRLLQAAAAGDLTNIVDAVSHLSIKEKESVDSNVFDAVLHSIVHYAAVDQTESAYATMMFIRAVGRYTSQAAISATLHSATPPARSPQRRYTDNVQQLKPQAMIYELDGNGLRKRSTDHVV
jgi:hypothetical protein